MSSQEITKILDALEMYIERFGPLESAVDLQATVGVLLSVMDEVTVAGAEMEMVIAQVIEVFKQKQTLRPSLEQAVERARNQLKGRQDELTSVVSGYVQKFAPQIDQPELVDVVQTAIAIMSDRKMSASEARGLTASILKTFDLDLALRRWVPPELIAVAQQIANYRQHRDIETTLMSVIQAYIQKFSALLSPELIREILEKGSGNLDPKALLAGDLDVLSDTIFLRFQLKQAAPKVTRQTEAIADQIHHSIETFRHQQNQNPAIGDITRPRPLGDLEVGSSLLTDKGQPL